jgi:hypothetical protein
MIRSGAQTSNIRSLPRRGKTGQPRASAAPPWVRGPQITPSPERAAQIAAVHIVLPFQGENLFSPFVPQGVALGYPAPAFQAGKPGLE